jgi:hypothetical protein
MHIGITPDIEDDIEFKETLLQFTQLVLYISKLSPIVVASE